MSASTINKAEVRRKLIQQACDTEHYWGSLIGQDNIRVSAETFREAEGAVDNWIRAFVARKQRKGKTL